MRFQGLAFWRTAWWWCERGKFQSPKFKAQTNSNGLNSKPITAGRSGSLNFGLLEFVWDLGFEFWNLERLLPERVQLRAQGQRRATRRRPAARCRARRARSPHGSSSTTAPQACNPRRAAASAHHTASSPASTSSGDPRRCLTAWSTALQSRSSHASETSTRTSQPFGQGEAAAALESRAP